MRKSQKFNAIYTLTLIASALALGSCTIVTIQEESARRMQSSGDFNEQEYAKQLWPIKVLPELKKRAIAIDTLTTQLVNDEKGTVEQLGIIPSDGASPTFVTSGEGVVSRIDKSTPNGKIYVKTSKQVLIIQTGPYVSGSSIRDSLPSINFNDFNSQIDFAAASRGLNNISLSLNESVIDGLAVGEKVKFLGAFAYSSKSNPIALTPVQIEEVR